jgi:hypothetical protein
VAAVLSFLDRSKGQQVYPSAPYWVERIVDAIRALPPAEPSDKPSAGCLWCGCERIDWEPTDTADAMALRCLGCGRWTSPSLHDPPTQRMAEPTAEEVERVAMAIYAGYLAQNAERYENEGPVRRTNCENAARAAIAAMRGGR